MANLIQTEEFKSEYSPNLLPIKSLFKETISVSYTGDGSVTIFEDNAFAIDSRSAYLFTTYDVVTGISETFSFGDALQFMTTKAGNYIFSFNMLNTSNFGDEVLTDLVVEVWVDGNLEYTFTTEYDFNTFEQDYFYNFNCGFQVIEGKEVSFVFKLNGAYPGAGITPLKLYFSGFKCELDDKYLNIPTAFSLPKFIGTLWQSRVDTTNTQSILANTDTNFGFVGTSSSNDTTSLISTNGLITPVFENDVISVDYYFDFEATTSTDKFIDVFIKVNSIIYRAETYTLSKNIGEIEYLSGSFRLPVEADFKTYGAQLVIRSSEAITIENRYLNAIETINIQ